MREPRVGDEGSITRAVEQAHSADAMGNPGARVLATPILGLFFEHAAIEALKDRLEEGARTLGIRLLVNHRAATPVGMKVTVKARLVEIRRQTLRFHLEAFDESEAIGDGEHDRVIVDWDRFMSSVEKKATSV